MLNSIRGLKQTKKVKKCVRWAADIFSIPFGGPPLSSDEFRIRLEKIRNSPEFEIRIRGRIWSLNSTVEFSLQMVKKILILTKPTSIAIQMTLLVSKVFFFDKK